MPYCQGLTYCQMLVQSQLFISLLNTFYHWFSDMKNIQMSGYFSGSSSQINFLFHCWQANKRDLKLSHNLCSTQKCPSSLFFSFLWRALVLGEQFYNCFQIGVPNLVWNQSNMAKILYFHFCLEELVHWLAGVTNTVIHLLLMAGSMGDPFLRAMA